MDNKFSEKVKREFIREINKDKWLRRILRNYAIYKQANMRKQSFSEKLRAKLSLNKETEEAK